jgi:hypothetical protein
VHFEHVITLYVTIFDIPCGVGYSCLAYHLPLPAPPDLFLHVNALDGHPEVMVLLNMHASKFIK